MQAHAHHSMRRLKILAPALLLVLLAIHSTEFEVNAEALRDQTHLADTYASHLQQLDDYFRSGVGDPSAIASELASLENERGNGRSAGFRLRVASALLSNDPQAIEKLSTSAVQFPISNTELETQPDATDAFTAINAIWLACIAHQKLEAAYHAADLLCQRLPESRYAKRLRALASIYQGNIIQAGNDLASLLDAPAQSFGLTYDYQFDKDDVAQRFWSSPLLLNTLPLCQEVRGLALKFNVCFDLPEVELWLDHAVTQSDISLELSKEQKNQHAWQYLLARLQFRNALQQGVADQATRARERIASFLKEPASNWLAHYLDMQYAVHFGSDVNATLTAFARLRTRLWPNLRNPSQPPAGVVHRQGMANAGHALAQATLGAVERSSNEELSANIKRFASSFYPFGASDDKLQTQFFALHVIDLIARNTPERLEQVRPLLREHLTLPFGQHHRPNAFSYFALEQATRLEPSEESMQHLRTACEWSVLLYGIEGIQVPGQEVSRQWLEQVRLNAQYAILPSSMPGGWSFTLASDVRACMSRAAKAVIAASQDEGKAELAELKAEVQKEIEEKLLPARSGAEKDDSIVGEYIWAIRQFAPLYQCYRSLRAHVSESVRAEVGDVDLKQIKRGLTSSDLASRIALFSSGDSASLQHDFVAHVIQELPAEGTLTPTEAIALGLASTLSNSLPQGEDSKATNQRLRSALEQMPLWGALGLQLLEEQLSLICGERKELADDTLELLMVTELNEITRLNLHLIQGGQSHYKYLIYQNATPESHAGFPQSVIEKLGRQHPSIALYLRSMREQMPLDYAGFHASMTRLNGYAWGLHSSYSEARAIPRIVNYGLALGGNAATQDTQEQAFALPAGVSTLEGVAHVLDTLAWGFFDAGEIEQAIAWENYALTLNPGDRLYTLTLERFAESQTTPSENQD